MGEGGWWREMSETFSGVFGVDAHAIETEYDHVFLFKMFDEGVEVWELDTATSEVGALHRKRGERRVSIGDQFGGVV